jgi:hypothetical protein
MSELIDCETLPLTMISPVEAWTMRANERGNPPSSLIELLPCTSTGIFRVCRTIARFVITSSLLTTIFPSVRHEISAFVVRTFADRSQHFV